MKNEVRMNVPYFQAPNGIFDQDLTEHELIVYLYLCRCGNHGGQAFPSYQTIADKCKVSRSTAIKTIRSLADKKLIAKQKRLKANNDNETNIYIVMTPSVRDTPPSAPDILPGVTDTPGASAPEEPPSAPGTPNKEIPYKEIDIDKEPEKKEETDPLSFYLGIWERQSTMKLGKPIEPTTEELTRLSDLIEGGVNEIDFQRTVKAYFAKKRIKYSLGNMLEAG